MDLIAELAKKKNTLANQPCLIWEKKLWKIGQSLQKKLKYFSYTNVSMHQQSTRWRHGTIKTHAVQVETLLQSAAHCYFGD